MKLFIVLGSVNYESFDTFLGAYSTRQLADERIVQVMPDDTGRVL